MTIEQRNVLSLKTSERTAMAIIGSIVSAIFAVIGWWLSYQDSKVVGGDAFNYIIGAGRGTALVGVALVIALLSVLVYLSVIVLWLKALVNVTIEGSVITPSVKEQGQ